MKHNNVVPNAHFKKDWQNRVKTWFNQPAKKAKRAQKRQDRAAALFPRPTETLKPLVRAPTARYNMKLRYGKGFSLAELKAAGISRQFAQTIGISVDHRRRNRDEEALQRNVQRLKEYQSKLVLFPIKAKKVNKGEVAADTAAEQVTGVVLPYSPAEEPVELRAITAEEAAADVYQLQRKLRTDAKLIGKRAKMLREKEEAAKMAKAGKGKKKKSKK